MPIASARSIAAIKLRAFVNKRMQEQHAATPLYDAEALAVVVVQGIEDLLTRSEGDEV